MNRRDSLLLSAGALALGGAAVGAARGSAAKGPRSLAEQVQMLMDVHEIQNVMSRYEFYHVAMMNQECVDLFVSKTPGAKVEIAHLGIYDGIENVKRFFLLANKPVGGERGRIGQMHLHTLTTPVIEVARDGKTAQGVWISPGVETGFKAPDGETQADWAWVKYGIDFAREEGQWKMWHFGMFRIFEAAYDRSWAAVPPGAPDGSNANLTGYELARARLVQSMPAEARPDRPNSYSWIYSPRVAWENVPRPPEPYDTWDDSRAYVK
jgi:SnoaL-like domain